MKKNLLISTLALLVFSAQAQLTAVPCDSIDITVDPNSTHSQPSFSSNWIQSSVYNNGTLSPYFATSSLSGILLSEDSAFTHNVLNISPSGSYYDTIVACFTVEGLDSLPNSPIGALTWSCGVDMSGNLIYCETFAWDGLVWNLITTPAPTPSWDCDPTIGCFDPGTGNGMYTTYADCDTNCSSNNWSWNNFTICDSLDVLVINSTPDSVTLGTNLSSLPYSGPVSYDWALIGPANAGGNSGLGLGSTVSTIASPTFGINPLDTTLYFLTIQLVDSTGMTWNCIYPFMVYWDNSQWVALKTESPTTNTLNLTPVNDKKILRIIDALGREVSRIEKNTLLFYIYDDGSIDKRIIR